MKTSNILKYITAGLFFFCVLCLFMPYASSPAASISGFNLIRFGLGLASSSAANMIFGHSNNMLTASIIVVFIVPVVLLFLSGIIMLFKPSIPKTFFVVLFSAISFLITNAFINEVGSSASIGIGLRFIQIISLIGIILPIVTVILYKKEKKKDVKVEEVAQ